MSKVELISLTPDAEKTMAYIARVSNPKNQENEDYSKLLSYCIKNEHWSVFEQSFMTLQIETNRGIAAQILRHRSFTFQEFSQRYADSSQLGNIPLGKFAELSDVSSAAVFLASDAASMITGTSLLVDGGWTAR